MTLALLGYLAHSVADFVLQSDEIARGKDGRSQYAYIRHGIHVLVCTFVATHAYALPGLIYSLIVAALHVTVDFLVRVGLTARHVGVGGVVVSLACDQALHIATITIPANLLDPPVNPGIVSAYQKIWSMAVPRGVQVFLSHKADTVLLMATAYVLAVFGGAILVRKVLDASGVLNKPLTDSAGDVTVRSGAYIGVLERAILLTLVLANSISSIGFVIAAKSLSRLREMEKQNFAEYYLIGTLTSALIALGTGIAVKALIGSLAR
ncbi:MAG: DUF3307 domain-containing protein [Firmicutes bacterium]|nr:DUF3307 domain-containing protein [Bacillota bacterium]